MKFLGFLLLITIALGCSSHPSLNEQDTSYIHTTLDLLRIRSNFAPNEDSAHRALSLDSVYRKDHTSALAYQAASELLSNDPKHAEAVLGAISDSIGKK